MTGLRLCHLPMRLARAIPIKVERREHRHRYCNVFEFRGVDTEHRGVCHALYLAVGFHRPFGHWAARLVHFRKARAPSPLASGGTLRAMASPGEIVRKEAFQFSGVRLAGVGGELLATIEAEPGIASDFGRRWAEAPSPLDDRPAYRSV